MPVPGGDILGNDDDSTSEYNLYGDISDELEAQENTYTTKKTCGCKDLKWYNGTHTAEEIAAHASAEALRKTNTINLSDYLGMCKDLSSS